MDFDFINIFIYRRVKWLSSGCQTPIQGLEEQGVMTPVQQSNALSL